MVDKQRINNTMGKMDFYLSTHNSIGVGVSGGSDSNIIVHIIATYFRQYLNKIHFVFADTGLEYRATREHIKYLEEKYNITVERVKGTPIPVAVRKYGVPILSKEYSTEVKYWIKGTSKRTILKVEGKLLDKNGNKASYNFSPKKRELAYAIRERGISVSKRCCDISKKAPLFKTYKTLGVDLTITGERIAEFGERSTSHKDCFESAKSHPWDQYRPLFFWDNETKQWYKEHEGIVYSDCYEVYGMKRTGCICCPFNSAVGDDLQMIAEHEPNLFRACMNIFGTSYRLMDEFQIHRKKNNESLHKALEIWDEQNREQYTKEN